MKVYLQAALVTVLVGMLFVGAFSWWRDRTEPKEAEQKVASLESMEKQGLPTFSATTLQGEKIQLDQYKGKLVVLNFWASWCGPCVEEFPSLLKLAKEMNGKMILVAVSGDSDREDIEKFMKQLGDWDKPWVKLVWDEDRHITQLYDVERLPESYVANAHLQLIKKITGSVDWYTPDSIHYMNQILNKDPAARN